MRLPLTEVADSAGRSLDTHDGGVRARLRTDRRRVVDGLGAVVGNCERGSGMKAQEDAVFVAINAIEVPAERADELAERFANRAGVVSSSPGFVRFELFRPADENTRWLVVTHWRSRDDFNTWLNSQRFGQGHAQERSGGPVGTGSELWQFQVEQSESAPST